MDRSRENLGLETVDVYYIHNPETQLSEIPRETFTTRIREAFGALEEACDEGKLTVYGTATWNGFRQPPEKRGHLSLEELVSAAREAGMTFDFLHVFDNHRIADQPRDLSFWISFVIGMQPVRIMIDLSTNATSP